MFDGDKDVAERVIERYKRVSSETFGRLAVDETLYLYTEMDAEDREVDAIGDLAECATASTRGAMATPARRNKRTAPFSPIRPKKIPLVVGPASPARLQRASPRRSGTRGDAHQSSHGDGVVVTRRRLRRIRRRQAREPSSIRATR